MPKNIVIFSDGTGQDGGARPEQRRSNVYKLYKACCVGPESPIDPNQQVAFYDPGLGTDIGATALTAPVRFVQKLLASVEGRGITRNIADCYQFIVNHYEPGDRVYLIGFSRGAYTVRCVANLLMLCGIPTTTPDGPLLRFRSMTRQIAEEAVDTVLEHGAGHPREEFEAERNELARRFRAKYGADHESGEPGRSNAAPHFVGVFDTVAALGARGLRRYLVEGGLALGAIVGTALLSAAPAAILAGLAALALRWSFGWTMFGLMAAAIVAVGGYLLWRQRKSVRKTIRDFPNPGDVYTHIAEWKGENFDRLLSRFVHYARSANAIDERRKDFARVGWGGRQEGADAEFEGHQRLIQLWFAGNHSDIGGSYDETESRLSDISLQWMLEQATGVADPLIVAGVATRDDILRNDRLRLHPSSAGVQHCEVVAMDDAIASKTPKWLKWATRSLSWDVEVRPIPSAAPVHESVEGRFALAAVQRPEGFLPYRPSALAGHDRFKARY